jgi:hypothetical protein
MLGAFVERNDRVNGDARDVSSRENMSPMVIGEFFVSKALIHADCPIFRCFCGSTVDPKPARLATPHSCASPCSRPRLCGHGCPLSCHPGPCPPCLGQWL